MPKQLNSIRLPLLVSLSALVLTTACSSKPKKPPEPEFSAYFASHIAADGQKTFQIAFHPKNQRDTQMSRGPGGGGRGGQGGGGGRGGNGGPPGGGGGRGGEEGRGGRGGHDVEAMRERREQMQELLLLHTDQILMNNGYCREGYDIARKQREERRSSFPTIKGSCKEKATPEDIERFPNASATYEIREESLDF